MKKLFFPVFFLCLTLQIFAAQKSDTIITRNGKLVIHFLGHASLYFEFNGKIIHIDPFSKVTNYTVLPKADLILSTHSHYDHFDMEAIDTIKKVETWMIFTEACQKTGKYKGNAEIMKNGDKKELLGITFEAVPAYNIMNKRPNGTPFHPKGEGNGYILTFDHIRIYIAGDTENIPEMGDLKNIDVAFLPMNLPYTMTPEMVASAALMFNPKILYPYHFGDTEVKKIAELLNNTNIEVRIRNMQ